MQAGEEGGAEAGEGGCASGWAAGVCAVCVCEWVLEREGVALVVCVVCGLGVCCSRVRAFCGCACVPGCVGVVGACVAWAEGGRVRGGGRGVDRGGGGQRREREGARVVGQRGEARERESIMEESSGGISKSSIFSFGGRERESSGRKMSGGREERGRIACEISL